RCILACLLMTVALLSFGQSRHGNTFVGRDGREFWTGPIGNTQWSNEIVPAFSIDSGFTLHSQAEIDQRREDMIDVAFKLWTHQPGKLPTLQANVQENVVPHAPPQIIGIGAALAPPLGTNGYPPGHYPANFGGRVDLATFNWPQIPVATEYIMGP